MAASDGAKSYGEAPCLDRGNLVTALRQFVGVAVEEGMGVDEAIVDDTGVLIFTPAGKPDGADWLQLFFASEGVEVGAVMAQYLNVEVSYSYSLTISIFSSALHLNHCVYIQCGLLCC